jgi:(2Fe-2S) ferredoxin
MVRGCYLCTGKSCSRRPGFAELRRQLTSVGEVRPVRCQSVCKGPVVGVEIAGRLEWFAKLRRPKAQKAIKRLVRDGGPVADRLQPLRVKKRAGQLRR